MRSIALRRLSLLVVAALAFPPFVGLSPTLHGQKRKRNTEETLEWPIGAPRVRFMEVLEPRSGGARRLLRRLAGTGAETALEGLDRPYGVAWHGEDLLVTDPGAGRVVRLSPRGRVEESYRGKLRSPIGVAVCDAGVVVSDSRAGSVLLLDEDLRFVRILAEGMERPTGVACHGEKIFVAETGAHCVVVLGDGESPVRFGRRGARAGEFNFPTSLATDGESLWIADTLNFRLQRLDASGVPLASFGRLGDSPGEMPRVKGVTVDRLGRLWVTDAHLDQVGLFTRDGGFLLGVGRTGGGPAEFSFPAGVAAHEDGRVAVVDSFNRRIQLFRTLGEVR